MELSDALAVLAAAVGSTAGSGIVGNAAYDGLKRALGFIAAVVRSKEPVRSDVQVALSKLPKDAPAEDVVAVLLPFLGQGGSVWVTAGNNGGGSVGVSSGISAGSGRSGGHVVIRAGDGGPSGSGGDVFVGGTVRAGDGIDAEDEAGYREWTNNLLEVFAAHPYIGVTFSPTQQRWAARAVREGLFERVDPTTLSLPGLINRGVP